MSLHVGSTKKTLILWIMTRSNHRLTQLTDLWTRENIMICTSGMLKKCVELDYYWSSSCYRVQI